jgi:AhpC/TSA family
MKKKYSAFIVFLAFLVTVSICKAQSPPPVSATICPFAPYVDSTGLFLNTGYQVGTTVPDFSLFDKIGNQVTLSSFLGQGKPIVLISGSYTCPQFRNCITNMIPQLNFLYDTLIEKINIYTLEAHPELPWNSPYAYGPWVASVNVAAGISLPQQQTYGDRLRFIDTTLANCPTNTVILADDTCNTWLSTFGPGPNMCYVLSENGVVLGKYGLGWNERAAIRNLLDQLLGLVTTNTNENIPVTHQLIYHPSLQASLITGYTAPYSLTIFDLSGRSIYEAIDLDPYQPFQFSQLQLASGTYLVSLNNGKHILRYIQP